MDAIVIRFTTTFFDESAGVNAAAGLTDSHIGMYN